MRSFPGILYLLTTAVLVVVPGLARGEVDPDKSFGAVQPDPYDTWSYRIGANWAPGSGLTFSYQPRDCNKAGPASTIPRDRLFHVDSNYVDTPWGSRFAANGRVSVYDKAQVDLGEFFPGEASGNAYELRNYGADQGPTNTLSAEIDAAIDEGLWYLHRQTNRAYNSFNIETPIGQALPAGLDGFVSQQVPLGGVNYSSLLFPEEYTGDVVVTLVDAGVDFFGNGCWNIQLPTDPHFLRTGRNGGNSWGSKLDDQWAIKRVGFTDDASSAWQMLTDPELDAELVTVAVIDTGLDWHHLDIDPASIWRNEREVPGNGVDDDQNGYIDDIIGWDFLGKHNRPWDFDGHGTLVTGIIAAAHNDVGIAGINPQARIMVLKGVGNFGTTRPSYIAEAIVYAVDNGAKIINISVGGMYANRMVQAAADYARQQGVLVVAAAGNEGIELDDYGPAGGENVLTVGATHDDNRGTGFANFGDKVDIAAPGVDVLSLRARYTDANYRPGQQAEGEYTIGDNYVGEDKRYLHVSGTSFSAPIVAGVASLVWSKNPALTVDQVEQILLQTAKDVELPGKDPHTGHGMVDARAALSVDASFYVTADISRVEIGPADAPAIARVYGTIDASEFKRAWLQIGPGENPGGWRYVGQKRKYPIKDGLLATFPLSQFAGADLWQVVVNVEHRNGVVKSAAFPVEVP